MHALIIEDQFLVGTMIESCLRDLGFTSFDRADNEDDAVMMAKRSCPSLITADAKLARGDGVNAVRRICEDQALPVVFITGGNDKFPHAVSHAVFISKPFTLLTLGEAVEAAMLNVRRIA